LEKSTDPVVVGFAGELLAAPRPALGATAETGRGSELLRRAAALSPKNPHWEEALQSPWPSGNRVAWLAGPIGEDDLWPQGTPADAGFPESAVSVAADVQRERVRTAESPDLPPALPSPAGGTVQLRVWIG